MYGYAGFVVFCTLVALILWDFWILIIFLINTYLCYSIIQLEFDFEKAKAFANQIVVMKHTYQPHLYQNRKTLQRIRESVLNTPVDYAETG